MEISSDSTTSDSDELITSTNLRRKKNPHQKNVWQKLMDRKSSTSIAKRKSSRKSSKDPRQTKVSLERKTLIPTKRNTELVSDSNLPSFDTDSDNESYAKSIKLRRKRKFNYFSWDSDDHKIDNETNKVEIEKEIHVPERRRSSKRRSSIKNLKAHSTLLRDSDSHGSLHFSDISRVAEEGSISQNSQLTNRISLKERKPLLLNEINSPVQLLSSNKNETTSNSKEKLDKINEINQKPPQNCSPSSFVALQKRSEDSINNEKLSRLSSAVIAQKTTENTIQTRKSRERSATPRKTPENTIQKRKSNQLSATPQKISEDVPKTRSSSQLSATPQKILENTVQKRKSNQLSATPQKISEDVPKTRSSSQLSATPQKILENTVQKRKSNQLSATPQKISEDVPKRRSSSRLSATPQKILENTVQKRKSNQLSATPQKISEDVPKRRSSSRLSATPQKISEDIPKTRSSSRLSSNLILLKQLQSSNRLNSSKTSISGELNKQKAKTILNRSLSNDKLSPISLKKQQIIKNVSKSSDYDVEDDRSFKENETPKRSGFQNRKRLNINKTEEENHNTIESIPVVVLNRSTSLDHLSIKSIKNTPKSSERSQKTEQMPNRLRTITILSPRSLNDSQSKKVYPKSPWYGSKNDQNIERADQSFEKVDQSSEIIRSVRLRSRSNSSEVQNLNLSPKTSKNSIGKGNSNRLSKKGEFNDKNETNFDVDLNRTSNSVSNDKSLSPNSIKYRKMSEILSKSLKYDIETVDPQSLRSESQNQIHTTAETKAISNSIEMSGRNLSLHQLESDSDNENEKIENKKNSSRSRSRLNLSHVQGHDSINKTKSITENILSDNENLTSKPRSNSIEKSKRKFSSHQIESDSENEIKYREFSKTQVEVKQFSRSQNLSKTVTDANASSNSREISRKKFSSHQLENDSNSENEEIENKKTSSRTRKSLNLSDVQRHNSTNKAKSIAENILPDNENLNPQNLISKTGSNSIEKSRRELLSLQLERDSDTTKEIKNRKTSYGGFKANLLLDDDKQSSLRKSEKLSSEVDHSIESYQSSRQDSDFDPKLKQDKSNNSQHTVNPIPFSKPQNIEKNSSELKQFQNSLANTQSSSNSNESYVLIHNSENMEIDRAVSSHKNMNKISQNDRIPLVILDQTSETNRNKSENSQSKKIITIPPSKGLSKTGKRLLRDVENEEIIKSRPTSFGKFTENLGNDQHSSKIQIKNSKSLIEQNQKIEDKTQHQNPLLNRTYFSTKYDGETTDSSDSEVHDQPSSSHRKKSSNISNRPGNVKSKLRNINENNLDKDSHDKQTSNKITNISNRAENVVLEKNLNSNNEKESIDLVKSVQQLISSNRNNAESSNFTDVLGQTRGSKLTESSSKPLGHEKKTTQSTLLKFLEHSKKIKDKLDLELKEKDKNKFNREMKTIPQQSAPTKIRQRNKVAIRTENDDDFKKINGKIYKPSKTKLPAKWIQPNLQSKIFSVLSNNYEEKIVNKKQQEIINLLAVVVKRISSQKKNIDYDLVDGLKLKLAKEKLIRTTYDFHHFVLDHCPHDFIQRVVPMKPYTNTSFNVPFDADTISDPIIK